MKKNKDNPVDATSRSPLAKCRPRGDRVVVHRDVPKEQTKGGIILPHSAQDVKLPIGTVVSVGPGKRDEQGNFIPIDLEVGDRVILTNWAGMEINDPGVPRSANDEYVIVREEDVIAFEC